MGKRPERNFEMITGTDYTYLSNINADKIAEGFLKKIKAMWPAALVDDERTEDGIEIFFSKDSAMDEFQDEHGYALNADGEGCFMFGARMFPCFQSDVDISNISAPATLISQEAFTSKIFLLRPWEYTLVLPALLEESDFSKKIERFLIESFCECQ